MCKVDSLRALGCAVGRLAAARPLGVRIQLLHSKMVNSNLHE